MKLSILKDWVEQVLNLAVTSVSCVKLAKAKGSTEYQQYAAVAKAILLQQHEECAINPKTGKQYDSMQTYKSGFYESYSGYFPEFRGEYGDMERTRFHEVLKVLQEVGVIHNLVKPVTAKKGRDAGVKKNKPFIQLAEYKTESSYSGSKSRGEKLLASIGVERREV